MYTCNTLVLVYLLIHSVQVVFSVWLKCGLNYLVNEGTILYFCLDDICRERIHKHLFQSVKTCIQKLHSLHNDDFTSFSIFKVAMSFTIAVLPSQLARFLDGFRIPISTAYIALEMPALRLDQNSIGCTIKLMQLMGLFIFTTGVVCSILIRQLLN